MPVPFAYILRNLAARRLTTALTVAGMALVVFVFATVLMLEEGSERARARDADGSDRIGGRPDDYHRKVQAAFHIIAAEEPERVKLVDASGTPVEVTERLLHAIEDLFA